MDIQQVIQKINVDEKALLGRFSGNYGLMERFLRKFPQDGTYGDLCAAMELRDPEAMLRAAHTLKGVSANLGFETLYRACSSMVDHLRAGRPEDAAADFGEVRREYETITGWLSLLE